jgi:hypothetical protein
LLKSIRHKFGVARGFSLMEWILLAQAWGLLLFFYLALIPISYQRLQGWTPKTPRKKPDPADSFAIAERLKRIVELSSRLHIIHMTCLVRSLSLRWMLRGRAVPVDLRIGVMKTQAVMQAHAWVELNGNPVGEADDVKERFKVLTQAEWFMPAKMKLV